MVADINEHGWVMVLFSNRAELDSSSRCVAWAELWADVVAPGSILLTVLFVRSCINLQA